MRRVLHMALHDTRLYVGARESIFFMFVMPVLFMLFFSVVNIGGPEQLNLISLQVVDEDETWLSEAFLEQLRGEEFGLTELTPAAADTTGFTRRVTVPAGFADSLLAGNQVAIEFEKDAGSNIEYDAAADVRLHQAQVAFLGALVAWNQPAGEKVTPERKAAFLALVSEPRRILVEERQAGDGRTVPSGSGQSIPGMLTMFVVMTVLIGGSESLTREKLEGTLARLATTPMSRGEILGGKLLHLGLVGVIQAMVLMGAGQLLGMIGLFGIDFSWGPYFWGVIIVVMPLAFASAAMALFLGGLFRTTQQAESLGWLIGMIFSALGGCWWSLEFVQGIPRVLGHFFPTFWAMTAFHGVVTFGRGLEAIVLPFIILVGFGALFTWLGVRTLKVTT